MTMPAGEIRHEPTAPVQAYCVHCRMRRPMYGAIQVCNRRGGNDLKGHCGVCGKSMYRLGGWDAVAAAQAAVRDSGPASARTE
jgi:hypothetical protein